MTTPARVSPQQAAAGLLRQYESVIAKLLERTGTSPAQFLAWIANAGRLNPQLWDCDHATLLGAVLRSAQLDLAPNTQANLAWIIPRKGRGGQLEATWQLGYGGILELARRAVPGIVFEGRPVYPGDTYVVEYGSAPRFRHVPHTARRRPRGGDATAWYVLATYPDGRQYHDDIDREEAERHRSYSQRADGDLWVKSYDAAALKSVVVNMRRWLPHTAQIGAALASDGTVIDVRDMPDDVEAIGDHMEETGQIEPPEPAEQTP